MVAQIPTAELPVPPQVDRLMERSKTEMIPPPPPRVDEGKNHLRSLEEVSVH